MLENIIVDCSPLTGTLRIGRLGKARTHLGDKCSACGFEHYGSGISHYHFCPNCGTLMDLEG